MISNRTKGTIFALLALAGILAGAYIFTDLVVVHPSKPVEVGIITNNVTPESEYHLDYNQGSTERT